MTTTMTRGDRLRIGIHKAVSLVVITLLSIVAIAAGEVLFAPPAHITFLEMCAMPLLVILYWRWAGIR